MKIYEGNSKAWDLHLISFVEITFRLFRQCDDNAHNAWEFLIDKYELKDEKQEILSEVTNRWNNSSIKDTSQDTDIWFNYLYNLNLKFKKIKATYGKYKDKRKAHFFDVLP